MTQINTTITEIGETVDGGVNFDATTFPCEIKYSHDIVVAEWDGHAYNIEEIKKILGHMEYVEQNG